MKTSIPEEGVHLTTLMNSYWNARYANGRIWGDDPCPSALMANEHFRSANVKDLLVPGCGYGRNSVFFAEKGYRVTAFDVSDVAIELATAQARERSIDIDYAVGDIFDAAFLTGKEFDGIYLSNVLHLFLAAERDKLVRRLTSLLKRGGIFAFSCISVFDTNNYGIGPEVEPNTFEKHEGKPLHFFDEIEIRTKLEADYKILEQKLHVQTEADPSGETEDLQLWFVAAQKL
ncbi:MAG: class I SAM-dependent methyltransferase [Alicyclobacillus macrosporangiidus]|uniref:class I SAM-dependent methyltransferase n=1 Tax=Alicyclobacillus macrosporangiidus TaxID=392015 RepID=UPI0026F206F8|nr:class I SAM-dependent methyltransferase [Alicyclobacillus macrosporangiidus]MCL6601166.1 class I SAM-dependent methyltransferase [Alicyclobacillus macrosporangiidus]